MDNTDAIFAVQITLHVIILATQIILGGRVRGNYEGLSVSEIYAEGARVSRKISLIGRLSIGLNIAVAVIFLILQQAVK